MYHIYRSYRIFALLISGHFIKEITLSFLGRREEGGWFWKERDWIWDCNNEVKQWIKLYFFQIIVYFFLVIQMIVYKPTKVRKILEKKKKLCFQETLGNMSIANFWRAPFVTLVGSTREKQFKEIIHISHLPIIIYTNSPY